LGEDGLPGEEALAAGGRPGFGGVFARYERLVRTLVARTIGAPSDVDDVAQDVFVEAYRKLDTLREPSRLKGWLTALALNRARSWGRRRRVEERALPRLARADESADRAGVAAEAGEERARLLAALATLPGDTQAVVRLRYLDGLQAPEIGARLGLTPEAVRMRLSRALRVLRERLDPPGAPPGRRDTRLE
jgi:RNA polymerase sigma-70 factor (ECF subfamily)